MADPFDTDAARRLLAEAHEAHKPSKLIYSNGEPCLMGRGCAYCGYDCMDNFGEHGMTCLSHAESLVFKSPEGRVKRQAGDLLCVLLAAAIEEVEALRLRNKELELRAAGPPATDAPNYPDWEWGMDAMAFTLPASTLDIIPGLLEMEWGDFRDLSGEGLNDALSQLAGWFKYVVPMQPKPANGCVVIELCAYGNTEGRSHGPEAAQLIQRIGGYILQREEFDALDARVAWMERCIAAEGTSTPGELLVELAGDRAYLVRRAVACNPAAPVQARLRLALDPSDDIRELAVEHPSVVRSEDWRDRYEAASVDSVSPELLAILAVDHHYFVRVAVARHPSAPAQTLAELAVDADPSVRRAAIENQLARGAQCLG